MRTAHAQARVLALGPARGPAAAASGGAARPWIAGDHIVLWRSLERQFHERATGHGCDVLHLTDVALAPFGRWLGPRMNLPVTIDVAPADLLAAGDDAERIFAAVDDLDVAYVFGSAGEAALCSRTRRVAVAPLPLIAAAREPDRDHLLAVSRLVDTVPPDRPVVVVPWTQDRAAFRWFSETVLAAFGTDVLWLIAGVPAGHLPAGGTPDGSPVRLLDTTVDDAAIAALARYADAFVVPWRLGDGAPAADALLRLALAASGTPLIAGDDGDGVLEHERNAFMVRAGDGAGFRATLDQLLTLPAKQRHYIGEELAEDALARWPVADAAAVYEDRFAALAGHPTIPAELRIA